jgi:pyruvate ferredoxin oxidoreductase beta subunit
MEDAKTVENDRYRFTEYVSEDAKEYLADRYGYREFLPRPAGAATKA